MKLYILHSEIGDHLTQYDPAKGQPDGTPCVSLYEDFINKRYTKKDLIKLLINCEFGKCGPRVD